jgi:hypothetical protein
MVCDNIVAFGVSIMSLDWLIFLAFASGSLLFTAGTYLLLNHYSRRIASTLFAVGLAVTLMAGLAGAERLYRKFVSFTETEQTVASAVAEPLKQSLLSQPRYRDPKRLALYEAKAFSQNGEDGIIAEIFQRIGTTNRYFTEFGSADGRENNTVLLLRQGWHGLWMDVNPDLVRAAEGYFRREVNSKQLQIVRAFITKENIQDLFRKAGVPAEFDLLSIDIDRNDYYVWEAIREFRPRAVVIEYNAIFPPTVDWVIEYDANAMWDVTSRYGASLAALERLGRTKGYSLVGCNLTGVNAFFVRNDLVGDKFSAPYTAANHYEPARDKIPVGVGGVSPRRP